jgi:hypothetical protein
MKAKFIIWVSVFFEAGDMGYSPNKDKFEGLRLKA